MVALLKPLTVAAATVSGSQGANTRAYTRDTGTETSSYHLPGASATPRVPLQLEARNPDPRGGGGGRIGLGGGGGLKDLFNPHKDSKPRKCETVRVTMTPSQSAPQTAGGTRGTGAPRVTTSVQCSSGRPRANMGANVYGQAAQLLRAGAGFLGAQGRPMARNHAR